MRYYMPLKSLAVFLFLSFSHLRSILFFHSRKCQKFHEPPDKCGFARPDRSYHPQKELALRTGLYIFVDSKWLHIEKSSSPILLLSICEKNFL